MQMASVPSQRTNKLWTHAHHCDCRAAAVIFANGTYFVDMSHKKLHIHCLDFQYKNAFKITLQCSYARGFLLNQKRWAWDNSIWRALNVTNKPIVRLEALVAVIMKSTIFWDVTQRSPVGVYWCFRGTYWLHLQRQKSKSSKHSKLCRENVAWVQGKIQALRGPTDIRRRIKEQGTYSISVMGQSLQRREKQWQDYQWEV
jgi:hypothetical protein